MADASSGEPITEHQVWAAIDHGLVKLKLNLIVDEAYTRYAEDRARIRLQNRDNKNVLAEPYQTLAAEGKRMDELAEKVYQAYCDTWERQGNRKSGALITAVCRWGVVPWIAARCNSLVGAFQLEEEGTSQFHPGLAQEFRHTMERLSDRWTQKLKIEALECEHAAKAAQQVPYLPDAAAEMREVAFRYVDSNSSGTDEANRPENATPAPTATESEEVFTPNDDYTLIRYRGETYSLTASAGKIVRVLHKVYKDGKMGMSYAEVRRQVKCGKVWDQFKRRDGRKFWAAFMKKEANDVLRLNLEPVSD